MGQDSPIVVVGLGNPGAQYSLTPHNLGFRVIEELERRWKAPQPSQKFHSLFCQVEIHGKKVFLARPQTYMNRSGLAVVEILQFYKVEAATGLVVITDDLDLPPATLRLRMNGGSGGHNGLNSIIESLGAENFQRVRIGVGRHERMAPDVYLLSKIPASLAPQLDEAILNAANAVEAVIKDGFAKAMNQFNRKEATP